MGKEEVDYLKNVSVYFLKKHGYLRGWMSGTMTWSRNGEQTGSVRIQSCIDGQEQYIRFTYSQTDRFTGEKADLDYKIPLITTPCHFGGFRYWFQCPWYANGVYCGRRVGVLYLGGKYFACRHCYNLTYNSRNLGGISKLAGQVISMPELDELETQVKRKWYAGKMTRRYQRFLRKEWKSMRQMKVMADGLGLYRKT